MNMECSLNVEGDPLLDFKKNKRNSSLEVAPSNILVTMSLLLIYGFQFRSAFLADQLLLRHGRPSRQFSAWLWTLTLTFEVDLDSIKVSQHAKYLYIG